VAKVTTASKLGGLTGYKNAIRGGADHIGDTIDFRGADRPARRGAAFLLWRGGLV
jgi:hypothetical protein